MRKTLTIILMIFIINLSFALAVIDSNLPRPDSATSGLTNQYDGMRIHVGSNITVTKVGVVSTTVFDYIRIIDQNNATLQSVNYHAGDYNYTFDVNLTENNNYYVVIWDNSGTFSYRAVGGSPYNHTGTYFNWTGSVNGNPVNESAAQDSSYTRSIDFIESELTGSGGCILDSDCGLCEKCNTTTSACVNQNSSEDLKNECNSGSYTSCTNAYTKVGQGDLCDGSGACTTGLSYNVSAGSICVGSGVETAANFTNYCGIWAACEINQTTVNSYYVGYAGDGTNTCADNNWTLINEEWISYTNSTGWTPTYGGSTLYYNGAYWYMGGLNIGNDGLNEVWNSTDGKTWVQVTASANWSGRYDFGSYVFDNKMWVVAGSNGSNNQTNDVWYSTNGKDWYYTTLNADFPARYAFGHFIFDNKMWIVGGYWNASKEKSNDVWYSSDGITWNSATTNAEFSQRAHNRALGYNGSMYVLGGYDGASYLNDVWVSTNGTNWTELTSNAGWSDRAHFGVTSLDRMYVYGGSGPGSNNEVWASNNGSGWVQLNDAYWADRTYLGYTSEGGNGRILMAGGTTGTIRTDFYTTSNYSTRAGYRINVTENAQTCQETNITTLPECTINADCPICQKCNATTSTCQNQTVLEDLKNECSITTTCNNNYSYTTTTGTCDGAGVCNTGSLYYPSNGHVCINSTNYNSIVTNTTYCNIWNECIIGRTNATQYYVGYLSDGSQTCDSTDWLQTGTYWNTTTSYLIATTELTPNNCSEVYYNTTIPPRPSVTGWDYLINGSIVKAAFVGYNTPLNGYLLLLIYCVITAIILLNAGVEVSFIIGLIFFAAFSVGPSITGTGSWFNTISFNLIIIILAAQLAATFYKFVVKT